MLKKFLLSVLAFLSLITPAFATTYYASTGGGGAASCVDNGANVCTLQRAVTVAAAGTNTILCAAGTYSLGTSLIFNGTNSGGTLTIDSESGLADVTIADGGGSNGVLYIQTGMLTGGVILNHINLSTTTGNSATLIENRSPETDITYKNATATNTATGGGSFLSFVNYTVSNQSQATVTGVYHSLKTAATTNVKAAQQITPTGSGIVGNRVALKLNRVGGSNPGLGGWDYRTADTLTVTIETNNVTVPSGTPVTNGTSVAKLAFDVNPNDEWTFFDFTTNFTLAAGTVYWIVLTPSYTASATNYIRWEVNTAGAYAGGDSATYDGTIWTLSAASTDYSFGIDRNHSRDATIQNATISTYSSLIACAWCQNVLIDNVDWTYTRSAGTNYALNFVTNPTTGNALNSLLVKDSSFDASVAGANFRFYDNGSSLEKTWTNKVAFYNNTIDTGAGQFLFMYRFLRRLLIRDNTITIGYTGNVGFNLGYEVDGIDPMEYSNYPFEQIIIEGNTFNFVGTSHNHVMRFGIGADGAIFRNNKVVAPNGIGAAGGQYGMVLKANNWLVEGNLFYGPGDTLYLLGHDNKIIGNTWVAYLSDSNSNVIHVYPCQDSIYGGRSCMPLDNYVVDNIFTSEGVQQALIICDTVACTGASAFGTGRTATYWSNVFNNNIYWTTIDQVMLFGASSTQDYVLKSEGIAGAQADWQSTTFSDYTSLSGLNELSSGSQIVNPALTSPSTGDFSTTSSSVVNQGSIDNTSIGGYQSAGSSSGGGGPFGAQPFGEAR